MQTPMFSESSRSLTMENAACSVSRRGLGETCTRSNEHLGSGSRRARLAERLCRKVVGTVRRELLDQVIVLGERHLVRLVRDYVRSYNDDRPHMALDGDAPAGRAV